ncbi:MAG: 4'-phosphopantetheinyl transferase [Sulfurovum sp. AS07-7]|nr:MAG: 4'-phosphopantetheinyl transferase [Sulfurovum sp. AS07-7]
MKIGTDIIAISRIEKAIEKHGNTFKERFLNEDEIALAKNSASVAGFWAAKEAISKAFGCGIGGELGFHDIIITKNSKGAPCFELSPQAQERFLIQKSSLSISHDGGFAIAVVVIDE